MSAPRLPRLLLLTDRSRLRLGRGLLRTVTECVEAGLRAVVVREHDLAPPARHALVRDLACLPGLVVVSSRRLDPAAHGVHLAAAQPAPAGDDRPACWGRSCHDHADLVRAATDGAAWATLSPWAATPSKPGHGPPVPREAYAAAPLPVLALGGLGLRPGDAAEALAAGAHGVAVMGAVMGAADPAAAVAALLAELGEDA